MAGLDIDAAGAAVTADETFAGEGGLDHAFQEAAETMGLAGGFFELVLHRVLERDDVAGVDDVLTTHRTLERTEDPPPDIWASNLIVGDMLIIAPDSAMIDSPRSSDTTARLNDG